MTRPTQSQVVMVCCSVFRAEVESLRRAHWPECRLVFLPSMMHMHPDRLAASLESVLSHEREQGHAVVLVYGDCCARMAVLDAMPGVARTRGKNCCELLLGAEKYRRMSHEGAFFLTPEWTRRWREVFLVELGLSHANAELFMRDLHHKFTYLDTGCVPVAEECLKECAAYCGLPCEVRRVSLETLLASIEEALLRLQTGEAEE